MNNNLHHPEFSVDYTERTWTERLFEAMKCHNRDLNPKLTMDDAAGGAKVLAPWSGLEKVMAECVPLHGSPDCTIDNKIMSVLSESDDSDISDASTSPIEIATRAKATGMLAAAMQTKAYCRDL